MIARTTTAAAEYASLLERIRVTGYAEEERQPDGRLSAPIYLGGFFRHGERGEVADAEEGEENGDESCRRRWFQKFAGCGLTEENSY